MKTSAILLAAAATIAAAQSIDELVSQIPECVLPCIVQGAEAAGCTQGDHACECQNVEEISSSVALCIVSLPEDKQCGDVSDVQKATDISAQVCSLVAGGATGTGTATGASSSATGSSTSSGTAAEKPTATETGDESSSTDDDSSSSDSSSTSSAAGAEETGNGANKAGFAWAGAAAVLAAAVL